MNLLMSFIKLSFWISVPALIGSIFLKDGLPIDLVPITEMIAKHTGLDITPLIDKCSEAVHNIKVALGIGSTK